MRAHRDFSETFRTILLDKLCNDLSCDTDAKLETDAFEMSEGDTKSPKRSVLCALCVAEPSRLDDRDD